MIKEAIVKIVNKEDLTYDEAYTVMNEIMSGQTSETQNAASLLHCQPKAPEQRRQMKLPDVRCHESTCDSCGDRNGIV